MMPTTTLKKLIHFLFIGLIHKMRMKEQKIEIINPKIIKLLTEKNLHFEDIFERPEYYDYITTVFIERKLLDPETGRWIDFNRGYKSVMISYLKYIHDLGFLKNNRKLNNREMQAICLNSFGVEISIDHIKHYKARKVLIKKIPPFSYFYITPITISVIDVIDLKDLIDTFLNLV